MIDWIETHSTISGFVFQIIFAVIVYLVYTRKRDKERFEDEKPKIFVDVHWNWIDFERIGENRLEPLRGRIEYMELSNLGKGLATDIEIIVYGEREYENFTDIVSIGRYTKKYLPPNHRGLYHRPTIVSSFQKGEFPQEVKISYRFRGDVQPQIRERIFPKKKEDRGYELMEYYPPSDVRSSSDDLVINKT